MRYVNHNNDMHCFCCLVNAQVQSKVTSVCLLSSKRHWGSNMVPFVRESNTLASTLACRHALCNCFLTQTLRWMIKKVLQTPYNDRKPRRKWRTFCSLNRKHTEVELYLSAPSMIQYRCLICDWMAPFITCNDSTQRNYVKNITV